MRSLLKKMVTIKAVRLELVSIISILFLIGSILLAGPSERLSQYLFNLPNLMATYFGEVILEKSDPLDRFVHEFDLSTSGGRGHRFDSVKSAPFVNLDLRRTFEFSKDDFKKSILASTPKEMRSQLKEFLPLVLELSEDYQVDPFWVLSVMWTESHFNPIAKSNKGALGLMQLMPETATHLAKELYQSSYGKRSRNLIYNPYVNIEMGVYYLRQLLVQFSGDYMRATVAYNVGPARLRQIIRESSDPKAVNEILSYNDYYQKVTKAYRDLSNSYLYIITNHKSAYEETYVVKNRSKESTETIKVVLPFFLPRYVSFESATHKAYRQNL